MGKYCGQQFFLSFGGQYCSLGHPSEGGPQTKHRWVPKINVKGVYLHSDPFCNTSAMQNSGPQEKKLPHSGMLRGAGRGALVRKACS